MVDAKSTNSAGLTDGPMIVVSPHADDAAYSIGGLIQKSRFKSQIHIVTLFGRSNFLRGSGFERNWRSVTRLRKREDEMFAARIGAGLTYLDFPEAALRLGPGAELFSNEVDAGVAVPHSLKTRVSRLFDRLRPRCLFVPLGIGSHCDHVIAREVTVTEARRRRLPLIYYEDFPYVADLTPQEVLTHVRSVDHKLRAAYVQIDIDAKLNNLTLYRSQITAEELQIVSRYTVRIRYHQPAERLWSVSSAKCLCALEAAKLGSGRAVGAGFLAGSLKPSSAGG